MRHLALDVVRDRTKRPHAYGLALFINRLAVGGWRMEVVGGGRCLAVDGALVRLPSDGRTCAATCKTTVLPRGTSAKMESAIA